MTKDPSLDEFDFGELDKLVIEEIDSFGEEGYDEENPETSSRDNIGKLGPERGRVES
jgi:hypothetical protein